MAQNVVRWKISSLNSFACLKELSCSGWTNLDIKDWWNRPEYGH